MVNVVAVSTPQTLQINNLDASTDYSIEGYCVSQIGTMSTLMTLSFSTASNGGYVSKMDLFFSSPLSIAHKIKVVCALALLFQVNYYKVSTADGYYCSELLNSRRLLQPSTTQPHQQQQILPRRMLSVPNNRV